MCVCVTNFTNRYKTANNGRIFDFKVSIEAYGHSASIYRFRIFKFGFMHACVRLSVHVYVCVMIFTNHYKTANNICITDFKVSKEVFLQK